MLLYNTLQLSGFAEPNSFMVVSGAYCVCFEYMRADEDLTGRWQRQHPENTHQEEHIIAIVGVSAFFHGDK